MPAVPNGANPLEILIKKLAVHGDLIRPKIFIKKPIYYQAIIPYFDNVFFRKFQILPRQPIFWLRQGGHIPILFEKVNKSEA